jgi:enolase-phosphatase E1
MSSTLPSGIQVIVTDIEGTTTSLAFVKEVLFPYARRRLAAVVRAEQATPFMAALLNKVATCAGLPLADVEAAIDTLHLWSDTDQKIAPLKTLQGYLWQQGYHQGDFKGHVYQDAYEALCHWHQQGYTLAVYSSGSVQAQRLLFSHSTFGDLSPLFQAYFDTALGPKVQPSSYTALAQALGKPPANVLFVSDHGDELAAAQTAGLAILGVNRDEHTHLKPKAHFPTGCPVVATLR